MSERVTIVAPTDPQLDWSDMDRAAALEALDRLVAALAAERQARQDAERELAEAVERGQNLVDGIGMEREMRRDAEAALADARRALEDFANPQHWGIDRSFHPPKAVWIGTYETGPVEHARAALASLPGEPPPPSEPTEGLPPDLARALNEPGGGVAGASAPANVCADDDESRPLPASAHPGSLSASGEPPPPSEARE